jgi:hypothetical protein
VGIRIAGVAFHIRAPIAMMAGSLDVIRRLVKNRSPGVKVIGIIEFRTLI